MKNRDLLANPEPEPKPEAEENGTMNENENNDNEMGEVNNEEQQPEEKEEEVTNERKPPISVEEMDDITLISKMKPESSDHWGGSITFLQRYVN